MCNVYDTENKRLLESVNTPDFIDDPRFIINPDISLIKAVPEKYLTVKDGIIAEATPEEKTAIDAEIITEKEAAFSPCPYGYSENCEHLNK